MLQGRLRSRKVDDHFASAKERLKIVCDRYASTATTRCVPCIVTHSVMALLFERTSQRKGGGLFDKSNQPAAHTTSCACDNDVEHPKLYPLLLELDEACIL